MPDKTQSKITRDALHAGERERLANVEKAFRIHAAALHGDALSPLMVDTLVNGLTDNAAVFSHLVTGNVEELDPGNSAAMRRFTRSVIEADEMAQRNLEFTLGHRKAALEAEFLAGLKQGEALRLHRQNLLEKRKAAYVAERLDARFA
ncbi:hypothetical protein RGUI_1076 [Rhodovulum sp. P5]|uniref:hypothetical protein n=1 Tax=Rhodovulum sp. P5 TaxID=1564506 RepID=UPI0009C23179|nr:hypothetical protein [Rhodovulum sp. P5]ARE39217.1 hypothetical protein RGUI_1076 [Rhodovulum sp. P5]